MNKRSLFLAIFLAGALLLAASPQAGAPSTPLENDIVKALFSLPHYSVYDNLYFTMDGSNVTLMGQVVLEITKAEAGKRVARIKGIGTVTNHIEILPPSPSDDALRTSIYRRLFDTPDLHRYSLGADPSIHIIVKGGHVTLEGAVSSEDDKNRAEVSLKSLPGIMSFKNNLRIVK